MLPDEIAVGENLVLDSLGRQFVFKIIRVYLKIYIRVPVDQPPVFKAAQKRTVGDHVPNPYIRPVEKRGDVEQEGAQGAATAGRGRPAAVDPERDLTVSGFEMTA